MRLRWRRATALPAASDSPAPLPSRPRQLVVLLVVAAVIFGIDHLTKSLVVQGIPLGQQIPASGPVTLRHVENRGAAFGLFPQLQFLFLGAAILVAGYILIAGRRFGPGIFPQVLLGLVLGGAVSNALDRAAQGYVVDFIDLQRWPVFNVADMAIVCGIVVGVLWMRVIPPAASGDVAR